jgi:hypothetical protein
VKVIATSIPVNRMAIQLEGKHRIFRRELIHGTSFCGLSIAVMRTLVPKNEEVTSGWR